jgi:integrase
MNRPGQPTHHSAWPWPIEMAQYNCRPELDEWERGALGRLPHPRRGTSKKDEGIYSHPSLRRLGQPLHDVLDVIGTTGPRTRTLSVLIGEMQRRESAFWAWSEPQGIVTIGTNRHAFTARHHITASATRQQIFAVGYLLCGVRALAEIKGYYRYAFAVKVFGTHAMAAAVHRVEEALHRLGYTATLPQGNWHNMLSEALLLNRSPLLEELTYEVLQLVRQQNATPPAARGSVALSRALHSLGILPRPLPSAGKGPARYNHHAPGSQVAEAWVRWCDRWRATSSSAERTRANVYTLLIKTGRWLMHHHPQVVSPAQWTRELAAEFVAAVDRMQVGEYLHPDSHHIATEKRGKPLMNNSKVAPITAVRGFFRDCQEWGWMIRRFDPIRAIPIPRKMLAQRTPSPRVIADDVWAKLLWAGLNVTADDLPVCTYRAGHTLQPKEVPWYPLTMVRAVSLLWLFAGLRSDEIRRLRMGCIRWQHTEAMEPASASCLSADMVCVLEVPINKTGAAFTKPVDRSVGEAIETWERERPVQPAVVDRKTGSLEHFLFLYRGKPIGTDYLNSTIIPMLCRKAGVPTADARGHLTSHRGRSTIASQLYNAAEPMSLFELQQWLGHRSVASTQYYVQITQTKLSKSYTDAGYFERNRHAIEVLLDQEIIRSGAAASGDAWKFYDLGHGYCSYDFFDQCPHRMACAKCAFYIPKESSRAQLLEAKAHLQRMMQEIPLQDEERAAVEDGLAAVEKLSAKLMDVPTPAGPTPRELHTSVRHPLPVVSVHHDHDKMQQNST